MSPERIPLLEHPLKASSAFTPEGLIAAVRAERGLATDPVPSICILEFDGDLTDWQVSTGALHPLHSWECFSHEHVFHRHWRNRSLVVPTEAIRDKDTSHHYLSASPSVVADAELADSLATGLQGLRVPVSRGTV